jgi:uncharacterized membrane protein YoaK (UPF0700 family)
MFPLIRDWLSVDRTNRANVRLGATLSFVAGAANAGGFLAVGQYTSHMTGVVSSIADNLVLGNLTLVLAGLGTLIAFVLGAMTTAWLVNWGLRRELRSSYGLPLLVEALALLVFGLFGAAIKVFAVVFLPLTVLVLCFIMGLQNAVITKISKAEIRTTHVTGLVTDLGIELGKLLYINRSGLQGKVVARRDKLRLHGLLITCFFVGGVVGALGFKHLGYVSSLALALILIVLVLRPLQQDLSHFLSTPRQG